MADVIVSLQFEGPKKAKTLTVLFSRHDSLSFIKEEVAAEIANLAPFRKPRKIILNGREIVTNRAITADFYINGIRLSDEFFVVPHMKYDAIINDATLRKWRIKVNEENNTLYVNPALARQQLI